MTNKNDITGDSLVSKTSTDAYREGYDRIFGGGAPVEVPSETKKLLITTAFLPPDRDCLTSRDEEEAE